MKACILGYGNMGTAIASGLITRYGSDIDLIVYDKLQEKRENASKNTRVVPPEKWFSDSIERPEAVILAVKPQEIKEALTVFSKKDTTDTLWISIAAGVKISTISESLRPDTRICRVMPNMPALLGEGMSAYAVTQNISEKDRGLIEKILSPLGDFIPVKESSMDAVTGLSGSGPAYVFTFIEALTEGGVAAGLRYETAQRMAVQTIKGCIEMLKTGESPNQLKTRIMSPGGTTVKGVQALERHGFRNSVIEAVTQAAKRSTELS